LSGVRSTLPHRVAASGVTVKQQKKPLAYDQGFKARNAGLGGWEISQGGGWDFSHILYTTIKVTAM